MQYIIYQYIFIGHIFKESFHNTSDGDYCVDYNSCVWGILMLMTFAFFFLYEHHTLDDANLAEKFFRIL